jgi:predicted MFS family arabinose efflux permease
MMGDACLIETSRRDHLLFAVVTLLYWISLYTYVPILAPYLLEVLGVSVVFAGIVLGSYGFMQILLRLPLGMFSDRVRRRRPFMALGMLTGTLACMMFVMGEQPGWALAARAMSGICASTWVAFTVLYASYYPKHEVGRAMSTISFLTVAGQLMGMGISGWLTEAFGNRAVFYVGAVAGAIGLLGTFAVKEPAGGVSRTPIRLPDLVVVMRNVSLWQVSILSILAHSVLFITMFGFTPSYATAVLGAARQDLTWLSFAFMIPHAIASLFTGRLIAPKIGSWTTIMIGFALSACCTLVIPFTTSMTALYWTQAVNGLTQGLHMPLFLGMAIAGVAREKQATAMGFYQAVYAAGMFGGPFTAGWVNAAGGLNAGFWLGGGVALLSVLVTIVFAASTRKGVRSASLGK